MKNKDNLMDYLLIDSLGSKEEYIK